MKLKDKQALRDLTIADLRKKLDALKKEFAVSSIHKSVGKLKNVKSLSTLRDTQAFILTIMKEKEKLQA